jgi:prepilin peptidase CpaA
MTNVQIAALVICVAAAVCDIRTRRIPNVLTFGGALAGILANLWIGGLNGGAVSLLGWIVGVACFFPLFALKGMGAGDLKLLGALGAWIGPVAVIWVALFSSIAGGVMALVVAVFSGYMTQALVNLGWMFQFWRASGPRPVPEMTLATQKGPRLAYAVPVLAGLTVALWLR